jgi:hypothetical protein
MKISALNIAMLLCIIAHSQGIKDTLFFNNGSLVIGELKRAKLGVVTFDPDDANDITVQLRKLKAIASGKRVFRIETIDHHLYFGTIKPHPASDNINILMTYDTIALALEDISVLYPVENSVLNRFSGSVGLGYSYTRSSGFGRLNFDGDMRYSSKKTELIIYFSGIYTIYDSLVSRDKEEFSFKYNYYFLRNWFTTALLAYQRNLELGLLRRFQEGLGIGNKFITSKHVYSLGRTGFVFNQEKNIEGENSGILTEVFGQLAFNFFRFQNPEINLLLTQTLFYSLSQSGRLRNDGSMKVNWETFKDFNLTLELYNNFDSKPPGGGNRKFDYGITFGINYKL